jgi:thiamine pyrophosphokinase
MTAFFRLFPVLSFVALVACGGGGPNAEQLQKDVEAAMQAKDYPTAIKKADEALAVDAIKGDAAKAWRFHSLRLNALAEGGKGKDVLTALGTLGGSYDKQLTAALYHALADKVRAAGDGGGYAELLDAGKKKFPEDASFQAAIDAAKNSADPAEVERLKALGYL